VISDFHSLDISDCKSDTSCQHGFASMNSDLKRFANLLVNTFGLDVIVVKQFISNVEFFGDPFDLAIAALIRKSLAPFQSSPLTFITKERSNIDLIRLITSEWIGKIINKA